MTTSFDPGTEFSDVFCQAPGICLDTSRSKCSHPMQEGLDVKCEPYCEFSNQFMSVLVLFNPHHCKFSNAGRGVDARRKLVPLLLSGRHLTRGGTECRSDT